MRRFVDVPQGMALANLKKRRLMLEKPLATPDLTFEPLSRIRSEKTLFQLPKVRPCLISIIPAYRLGFSDKIGQ